MTASTISLLISWVLCVRCVSSDEDCLSPRAPTGADVSFFSTLGCSLRGALTSGSMALALLSPFIWSERVLAPVLVCRWPSFHLASPLSPLSSPDSWLPQPAANRRQVLGPHRHTHALQAHASLRRDGWDASGFWGRTPPLFSHSHSHLLECVSTPFYPACLSRVFSLFLWSLESGRKELIDFLEGNQLWTRVALTSTHPWSKTYPCLLQLLHQQAFPISTSIPHCFIQ